MFKLSGNQVVRTFNQGKSLLQKNSPAILMGLGVVGVVASTVLACKATLKLDEVKYVADENIEHVHQGREKYDEEVYSQESYRALYIECVMPIVSSINHRVVIVVLLPLIELYANHDTYSLYEFSIKKQIYFR